MRVVPRLASVVGLAVLLEAGCTPDWATQNESPFILEIARITDGDGSDVFLSDVGIPITNDNAVVTVNVFRKNNQTALGVSPVEHVYLERYEVRYFRSDGRNQEGVDVPYRISGPLGNVRFHTAGPGGEGEQEAEVAIILVRHQAKAEPPLRNLQGQLLQGGVVGDSGLPIFPGAGVLTVLAEVTIYGRTVQGAGLRASGTVQITFADFPNEGWGGGQTP